MDALNSLSWAHPIVRDWFIEKFGDPTEPQEQGWPPIVAGSATLISAPTGSGKTLAAFLVCIDRLVRKSLEGRLRDQTEVVYVSPLRALSNDVEKNLRAPLREIGLIAGQRGMLMPPIRTAVRTGDTLNRDRIKMLRFPPHILVTTPESLYILLTAEKSRAILRNVRTVIVDEIHAMADDKRGAHLALSLERLHALADQPPIRIGLSATQKPITAVAGFLSGDGRSEPAIVNIGHRREMDLAVEAPPSELGPIASHELWNEIHERLAALVNEHRSTLVFVNTRKLAERTAHRLAKKLGEDVVAAHHGSLSRAIRLAAETKLKNGELKVLVATASLELGIDVGSIDLVCQIGSPRSIAVALQRIGRAGHWRGAVAKGRLFPTTRDELFECAALVRATLRGELDCLQIPEAPLDILAQQITAACAAEEWEEEKLFALVRAAYPYRNLTRAQFDSVIEMLSEGIAASRGRQGAHIHRDAVKRSLRGRRGSRLTAITSGGAIPETGNYTVIADPEEKVVGTLDEDFAVESNQGDVILLGTTSWIIRRVESRSSRVRVEDAHGAPPSVPFWRGEAPGRTAELSASLSNLRETLDRMLPAATPFPVKSSNPDAAAAVTWLRKECGIDDSAAEQICNYLLEGRSILGEVPTQKTVVAERFFDESGGMQLVIHAPFGARINRAWGLALRKRFCRSFNLELQASATDDGLNISLAEQHSFPLADVFHFLSSNSIERILSQAVLASPLFGTRWRWAAMRALALARFRSGKKIPLQLLRMRADDLLASVFPDAAACQDNITGPIELPDHPLVNETMKDVLQEAMDTQGLKEVLAQIEAGNIRYFAADTSLPSPFCHEILNANPYAYLDDAPLEERRARAVTLRRILPQSVVSEVGMLDPEAILQVLERARPDIRNADDLHDTLLSLIALPDTTECFPHLQPSDSWQQFAGQLAKEGRVGIAQHHGLHFWFAAERAGLFQAAYPDANVLRSPVRIDAKCFTQEEAIWRIIQGWMQFCGPATLAQLSQTLRIAAADLEPAILRLESSGAILRGKFRRLKESEGIEWCDRRLLSQIHRLTIGSLRKQIHPVTPAQFLRWLFRWQHVSPGTQLHGERGLSEALGQLQGFEIPAREWEKQVLARRVSDYHSSMLDRLCWTGTVGWRCLSGSSRSKKLPGSIAPISFFLREDSDWLASSFPAAELSADAAVVKQCLQRRGASFISDLARTAGLPGSRLEAALWELVTAGVVTADGFDALRALLAGKKQSAASKTGAGRWSLFDASENGEKENRIESICRLLLNRYGIVFRDLLQRESVIPRWRDVLMFLRLLEDRGEVRGGRFVSGFVGEQFALPLAVDSLRAIRKIEPSGEIVAISPADPLNLTGIIVPGDRIAILTRCTVLYRDGVALPPVHSLR